MSPPSKMFCEGHLTGCQINMAISMRMATLMQLHREETYVIPSPTKELVIRAESARRTLVSLRDFVWLALRG